MDLSVGEEWKKDKCEKVKSEKRIVFQSGFFERFLYVLNKHDNEICRSESEENYDYVEQGGIDTSVSAFCPNDDVRSVIIQIFLNTGESYHKG